MPLAPKPATSDMCSPHSCPLAMRCCMRLLLTLPASLQTPSLAAPTRHTLRLEAMATRRQHTRESWHCAGWGENSNQCGGPHSLWSGCLASAALAQARGCGTPVCLLAMEGLPRRSGRSLTSGLPWSAITAPPTAPNTPTAALCTHTCRVLAAACLGKASCSVYAHWSTFTDPCPGNGEVACQLLHS